MVSGPVRFTIDAADSSPGFTEINRMRPCGPEPPAPCNPEASRLANLVGAVPALVRLLTLISTIQKRQYGRVLLLLLAGSQA